MNILNSIDRALGIALRTITITCLVILMFILGGNVIARFTNWFSLGWYDEIIQLSFAWMVFFGAAELWRENQHFRIDWLFYTLPRAKRRLHTFLVALVNILFLSFLLFEGTFLAQKSSASTPILGLPVALLYCCVPISAAIMLIYAITDLFRHSPRYADEIHVVDDL